MDTLQKKWRIVLTKPGAEKRVCESLHKKHIEFYFATNFSIRQRQTKGRRIEHALFDRYIFVRVDDSELTIPRQVEGVQQFIYWLGKPAIISQNDIEIIRAFTQQYANVKLEKIPVNPLETGSTEIYNEECDDPIVPGKKYKATLPALGYILVASVAAPAIEVLSVSRHEKHSFYNFFTSSLH